MKQRISKKNVIVSSIITAVTIGAVSGVAAISSSPQTAGADDSPIVQQLSDHERRLKNTENNVKDLQTNTGTPESADNTDTQSTSNQSFTTTSTPQAASSQTTTVHPSEQEVFTTTDLTTRTVDSVTVTQLPDFTIPQ